MVFMSINLIHLQSWQRLCSAKENYSVTARSEMNRKMRSWGKEWFYCNLELSSLICALRKSFGLCLFCTLFWLSSWSYDWTRTLEKTYCFLGKWPLWCSFSMLVLSGLNFIYYCLFYINYKDILMQISILSNVDVLVYENDSSLYS